MGLVDEINKVAKPLSGLKDISSPLIGGGNSGNQLFNNLMPQKKNVEQDATNGLVNETTLDQEIQNQAPKAEGGDLGFGKGGFDWKNALGSALSNFGGGGGESSSQQAPVSFNPQNAQIAQAQMIQPTQQQALANIGKRNLYDYLMG